MPVASPAASASSKSVGTDSAAVFSQSPRAREGPTLSTPARVFKPVTMADMVPAESGTCWSVL